MKELRAAVPSPSPSLAFELSCVAQETDRSHTDQGKSEVV